MITTELLDFSNGVWSMATSVMETLSKNFYFDGKELFRQKLCDTHIYLDDMKSKITFERFLRRQKYDI